MSKRVAIVAGSTGTLGRAVSAALIDDGWYVVGGSRSEPDRLSRRSEHVVADVGDIEDLRALVAAGERAGDVGAAVYCAGTTLRAPVLTTQLEDIESVMRVNTIGAMTFSQFAIRPMARRKKGSVVLLGSTAGRFGMPGQAAYSASKGALDAWVRSASLESGRLGVRLNVVSPGLVNTDVEVDPHTQAERDFALDRIPLRRAGRPDEIAAVVSFLVSDRSSYIHGATIPVDGAFRP